MLSLRSNSIGFATKLALATAMVVGSQLSLTPVAQAAGTVWVQNGMLHVTAARGKVNQIRITYSHGRFVVTDTHALGVGHGCLTGRTRLVRAVSCDATSVTGLVIDTKDQDDRVEYTGLAPAVIYGRGGSDTLSGGYGHDLLVGGSGDDRLENSVGNDVFLGDGGKDLMLAGPTPAIADADVFDGGSGLDTVTYSSRSSAVNVLIDDVANDGAPLERDNVKASVETLIGSLAADEIGGSPGNDRIDGLDGDDTIDGADGLDELAGGNGDDHLFGSGGWDNLYGGSGADTCDVGFGGGMEWSCER